MDPVNQYYKFKKSIILSSAIIDASKLHAKDIH